MALSRVFNGCRVMLEAAKAGSPGSSTAAAAFTTSAAKKTTRAAPASPSKTSKPATSKPATPKPATPKAPTRPSGIQKPAPVSPALHEFAGVPEISRADAVKKIWDYIKLHNLQDPINRREVHCDEKLKTIFAGKDKVGIMEISKLLSAHFVKTV